MNTLIACLHLPAADERDDLVRVAEACLRLSPVIALRRGEAIFVEVGKDWRRPTREGLQARLLVLARRFGLESGARVGFGSNAGEALAQAKCFLRARHAVPVPKRYELQALHAYASPFQYDREAESQIDQMLAMLQTLGLKNLGDFLNLPSQSLGQRFGRLAATLQDRVRGDFSVAWPRFAPPSKLEVFEKCVDVFTDEGCANYEALDFYLKRLLDRLSARLWGRGRRASRLRLELRSRLGNRLLDLNFPLPQAGARGMLAVAVERLRRQSLPPAPVESLRAEVLETAPGLSSQPDFFRRREEERENFNALVDRLSEALGSDQVFLAELVQRYLPEGAWKRVMQEASGRATGPPLRDVRGPQRPLRLLKNPYPLQKSGHFLLDFRKGRRWTATRWQGPERLSGEWWQAPVQEGFHRDYYRVQTKEGQGLWIFRDSDPAVESVQEDGQVYLQGVFD